MKKIWLLVLLLSAAACAARLELTAGRTYVYTADSAITRLINADPALAAVSPGAAANKLTIRAQNIGTAKVYYWTTRQEVLVLQISGQTAPPRRTVSRVKDTGKYELYFKFDPANDTPVNQRMVIQDLEYRTQTAGGMQIDLAARYKQNAVSAGEDIGQVERASLRLAKQGNYLQAGDATLRYSELALPYLDIQGLSGRYRWGAVTLQAFSGRRPGNYWGSRVAENYLETKDKSVAVSGGRLDWLVNSALGLGFTLGSRSAPSANLNGGDYTVQAVDVRYHQDNYQAVYELAGSRQNDASASGYRGEVAYDAEKLGWQIAYRDVAPEYRSLADFFDYAGLLGWSFYGRANPWRNIRLSGSYENYTQRFAEKYLTNPDHAVERLRLRLALDRIVFFRPALLYHTNYREDYRSSGLTAQLYEIELLRRQLWAYYNFSTWRYAAPAAQYATHSSLAGLTYRWGWFTWKTERVQEASRFVFGGEHYDSSGWNVIANFGDFTLPAAVKLSVSYWYQNRKNNLDTLDKNRGSLRLRLGQALGDLYWYLNGVAARENSLFYEYEGEYDRDGYFYHDKLTQSEISGGLVYRF